MAEPPGGSPLRSLAPFWREAPHPERSLFFWFYAAGKRSVIVDPADPGALDRLVAAADVVIDDSGEAFGFPAARAAHRVPAGPAAATRRSSASGSVGSMTTLRLPAA